MKIFDEVKMLLTRYPQLRDDDKRLIWTIWFRQGLAYGDRITKDDFVEKAETPDTITRARRKVQEENPDLCASSLIQVMRKGKEETKGEFVKKEEFSSNASLESIGLLTKAWKETLRKSRT